MMAGVDMTPSTSQGALSGFGSSAAEPPAAAAPDDLASFPVDVESLPGDGDGDGATSALRFLPFGPSSHLSGGGVEDQEALGDMEPTPKGYNQTRSASPGGQARNGGGPGGKAGD